MRELFSAFNSEVFRPLMTLFAPGAIALTPWVIGLMQRFPWFYSLINDNRTEATLMLTLIALISGMLLEDFGSHLESRIFDKALNAETNGRHMTDWDRYLRIVYETEPIGAKYIRSILLRMKFELGMSTALLIAAAGVFATTLAPWPDATVICSSAFGMAALLFEEGRRSHAALSKTRCLLLEGLIDISPRPRVPVTVGSVDPVAQG